MTRDRHVFPRAPFWVHGVSWGGFGLIFSILWILFFLYQDTDIWFLWMGNEPKDQGAFAEAVTPGIFRTRANTWSNLGYILVGIYLLSFAGWDASRATTWRDPHVVRYPALSGLYGVACIILGLGSGLMHASMMPFGHKMDVFGMFFVFITLIVLQWEHWFPAFPISGRMIPTWPFFGMTAIALSVVLMLVDRKALGGTVVILGFLVSLVGLGIGVDWLKKGVSRQYRWLFLAIATLVVAGICQRLDVHRRFAPPDTWLQGHAIWHLLTALSFASLARYYRSGTSPANKNIPTIDR